MKKIFAFMVLLSIVGASAFAQESDVQAKENEFGVSAQLRSTMFGTKTMDATERY